MKKNALYSIIIAILINLASSVVYALIEEVNFIAAFLQIWKFLFDLIAQFINFEIRIWQLTILMILLCTLLYFFRLYQSKSISNISEEFMRYNSGRYRSISFKWTIEQYNNLVSINRDSFRPVCICGGELTQKSQIGNRYFSKRILFCVNCEKPINADYDEEIHNDALLFFSNNLGKKIDEHNRAIFDKS